MRFAILLVLLNIRQSFLYMFILFSDGYFSFLWYSLLLFSDEVRRPGVNQGSRFISFCLGVIVLMGKDVSNALEYIFIKQLYASSGDWKFITWVKSAASSFV